MLLLVVGLATLQVHLAVFVVTVVGRRPIEVNAIHHDHGRVFPVPPIEMHDAARAGDHAAAGRDLAHQDAIRAHRGRDFTVCVEGNHRPNVGTEGAHLVLVLRRPNRADFLQPQGGVGHDEARVQVLACGVDDVVVLLTVDLETAADVIDFAVSKAHGTIFQNVACAQMGRGPQR